MKIAIIGAGISGLSAAYELAKKGHDITIFEKSDDIGGLGSCVEIGNNYIEKFYHHFFESDKDMIELSKELQIYDKLKFYKAKTGIYIDNKVYNFTSPLDLLKFSPVSFFGRLRCGIMAFIFKILSFPIPVLDNISAKKLVYIFAGKDVYKKIWGPLLEGKFSKYSNFVPSLWLWGRIHDRSFRLGYFDGGLKTLFDALVVNLKNLGVKIKLKSEVCFVTKKNNKVILRENGKNSVFDKVIIAAISPIAAKLVKNLSQEYKEKLLSIDHLGTICLLVELKYPLQSQYWLNICDKNSPVLVMVEHTNMVDKNQYGKKTIVYLANYVHRYDPKFSKKDGELKDEYLGFLKKINKLFDKSWILKTHIFKSPFTQTIFKLGALKRIPEIEIHEKNIFMINIDQMYPHDRTISQGIGLGKKVAEIILK